LDQAEQSALWELRTRWLGSYLIRLANNTWSAQRHSDPATVVTADSPEELEDAIRQDYATMSRAAAP
jgi:hypothetical protein